MAEPYVDISGSKHWRPLREGLGDYDYIVRGTGSATDDATNLTAAETQLNSWGEGRLIIDGYVIKTVDLNFQGDIMVEGMTPSATIEERSSTAYPIAWNRNWDQTDETSYSFSMASAFAEKFTPSGTTLSEGDWCLLWSADNIADAPKHFGAYGGSQRPAELHQVHHWDSVGGDAYVDSFIVDEMTTTPLFVTVPMNRGCGVRNLNMVWGGGTMSDYAVALLFQCCLGARVENVKMYRYGPGAVAAQYCAGFEIDSLFYEGQSKPEQVYATWAAVVNGFRLHSSHIIGSRHAFTTASAGTGLDTGYIRYGTPLGVVVSNNTLEVPTKMLTATPTWTSRIMLDTHCEGWGVVFEGNTVYCQSHTNGANVGIQSRSRATVIKNNTVVGGYHTSASRTTTGIAIYGPDNEVYGNTLKRHWRGVRTEVHSDGIDYTQRLRVHGNKFYEISCCPVMISGANSRAYQNEFDALCGGTDYDGFKDVLVQCGRLEPAQSWTYVTDTITTPAAHGFADGYEVRFRAAAGATLPTSSETSLPLVEGTSYYVQDAPSSTTLKIASSRGGSAITLSSGSGTWYIDGPMFPESGLEVHDNVAPKGSNSKFLEPNGLDETELEVFGNTITGYGAGTNVFYDTYETASDLWDAYASTNLTDDGYNNLNDSTNKVLRISSGTVYSYNTLSLAIAAASAGDTVVIPRIGCAISSPVTVSLDNITFTCTGDNGLIYRATSTTDITYLVYVTGDGFRCVGVDFDGDGSGTNANAGRLLQIDGDDARVHRCKFLEAYTTGTASSCYGLLISGHRAKVTECETKDGTYGGIYVSGNHGNLRGNASYDDPVAIRGTFSTATDSLTISDQFVYASTGANGRIYISSASNPPELSRLHVERLVMELPNFDLAANTGALQVYGVDHVTISHSHIEHPTHGSNDVPSLSFTGDINRIDVEACDLSGRIVVTNRVATVSSVDDPTDTITCSASHGLAANQKVMFYNSTPANLPTGVDSETIYYVKNPSGADLQISESYGGSAKTLSSVGSGTTYIYGIPERVSVRSTEIAKDCPESYAIYMTGGADVFEMSRCTVGDFSSTVVRFVCCPDTGKWDITDNRFITDAAGTVYIASPWIRSSGILVYSDNIEDARGSGSIATSSNSDQAELFKTYGRTRGVYADDGAYPSTTTVTWAKGTRWIDLDADAADNGAYRVVIAGTSPTWKYETTIES